MPILEAVHFNPKLACFYQRLRKKGKATKVSLTACMRKLLTILNVMLKTNQYWNSKIAIDSQDGSIRAENSFKIKFTI